VGWNGTSNTPYTGVLQTAEAWNIVNLGVSGQTCATILTKIPAYLAQYANQAEHPGVAAIWCGTNDLYYGATAKQAFALYQAIHRAFRTAGWKTIAVTMLSRNGYDTAKDQFNQLIRSQQGFYDQLVDLGANANIGLDGAYASGTYFYTDGTHPLQAVHQTIIAPAISQALNYVAAGISGPLPYWGTNAVVNGTFASSASWSMIGAGWSIAGGQASMSGAAGTQLLYQAGLATSGHWYAVTYTITANSSFNAGGAVMANLGGMTNQQGIAQCHSAPGTYTDILYADATTNGNLVFDGGQACVVAFTGSIANVTMQPITLSGNTPGMTCQTAGGIAYRAAGSACQ
jgi:hypothetical protein